MAADLSELYKLAGLTPPTVAESGAAHPVGAAAIPAQQPAGGSSARAVWAQKSRADASAASPAGGAQEVAQNAQQAAQPRAQEVAQPTRAAQEMPPDLSSLADDFPRFVGALKAAGRPTYSTYKFARLDVSTGSTWEGIIQARQVAQPRPVTDTAAQDMSAETARG